LVTEDARSIVLSGSNAWKSYVNELIPGGFDCRKHPIYIAEAISHAKRNFRTHNFKISYGSTEMFKLGEAIYPIVSSAVERARRLKKGFVRLPI
jgi:hypothetical protein